MTSFCETPTAATIGKVAAYLREHQGMGPLVGAPGIGKTFTLEHLCKTTQNTWMLGASPAYASDSAVLDAMIAAVRACPVGRGNAIKYDAINHKILDQESLGKGLLIVDEAQHLRPSQIEIIRRVHDVTEVGVILAGNPHVTNRYYKRSGQALMLDPKYAQITSRFMKHVNLPGSQRGDVKALCEHYGLSDERAVERLWPFAQVGGLRRVSHILEQAKKIAGGDPITFDIIDEICRAEEM